VVKRAFNSGSVTLKPARRECQISARVPALAALQRLSALGGSCDDDWVASSLPHRPIRQAIEYGGNAPMDCPEPCSALATIVIPIRSGTAGWAALDD